MSRAAENPRAAVDGYHVPEPLKGYEVWVVWAPDLGKTARAPWQEGHMYPADWAEDGPHDPRTAYDRAASVASLSPEQIHTNWPFPPDDPLPSAVKPAVLLPPASAHAGLLFADLDDVREPATGAVTPEARAIVERLGGYAEVSRSGTGLHVWVRARLPDDLGKFIEPLEGSGQLEMYDRGRMTGGTWTHVEGTPRDAVPEAQDTVDTLVGEYATETCDACDEWTRSKDLPDEDPECPACGEPLAAENDIERPPGGSAPRAAAGRNAYYNLDLGVVSGVPDGWQGPHPAHGGTAHPDSESTNFRRDGDVWTCYAHGTGGGALTLLAVLEGVVACRNADRVHGDRLTLLRSCLAAREREPSLEGEAPPYEALVAVAEQVGLRMKDADEGVLGKPAYKVARRVFDDLTPGDV